MDGRLTWTDCDEAGDYVVSNVLSPRDLVFRPDNIDETVPHTYRQDVRVIKTMCGADCWTDHRLVVNKLCIIIQPARQPQGKNQSS